MPLLMPSPCTQQCACTQALAGHFVLNGQAVALPGVRVTDSLALKVEALRVYLEAALGTDPFLK